MVGCDAGNFCRQLPLKVQYHPYTSPANRPGSTTRLVRHCSDLLKWRLAASAALVVPGRLLRLVGAGRVAEAHGVFFMCEVERTGDRAACQDGSPILTHKPTC